MDPAIAEKVYQKIDFILPKAAEMVNNDDFFVRISSSIYSAVGKDIENTKRLEETLAEKSSSKRKTADVAATAEPEDANGAEEAREGAATTERKKARVG